MLIYECMEELEKFNETSLPEKEEFCCNINMEDITYEYFMHAKRGCKSFKKIR